MAADARFLLVSATLPRGSHVETDRYDVKAAVRRAQDRALLAESLGVDAILIADFISGPSDPARWGGLTPDQLDPVLLATAIASATSRIGIVVTVATTFDLPYQVARRTLTLDHLAGGRVGWNVVTSMSESGAHAVGWDSLPPHDTRYAVADEYVAIVESFWNSFAEVRYRPDGRPVDTAKIRSTHFSGEHLAANGVLGLPPSPQGRPAIFQAGQSDEGLDLAAKYADAVFVGKETREKVSAVRQELRARSRSFGRTVPPQVYSSLSFTLADTVDEAQRLALEFEESKPLEARVEHIKKYVERGAWEPDLSDLDSIVPPFPATTELRRTGLEFYQQVHAERPQWTLRDFLVRVRGGHFYSFVGTPEQLADEITDWIESGVTDGYALQPTGARPEAQLRLFGERVIPLLESRGVRTPKPDPISLRERLGIAHEPAL